MEARASQAKSQSQTKVSIACESCRTRKRKCDGKKPVCRGCQNGGHSCHYRDISSQPKFVFKPVHVAGSADGKRRKVSVDATPSAPQPTSSHKAPPQFLHHNSSPPAHQPHAHHSQYSQQSQQSQQPVANHELESQHAAPLHSPPTEQSERSWGVRIPFFRWFGPTGIAPGYKKYMTEVKFASDAQEPLSPPTSDATAPGQPHQRYAHGTPRKPEPETVYFDPEDNLTPARDLLYPLLDTFFDYYGCHFPFHSHDAFIDSVKEKKVSAILLNSMCAMAARFSTLSVFDGQIAYLRGEVFANKAKVLLVPLLNLPSYEVVESILMIAWMEMATCHDAGLWMYTGMAVRMAEDLGMHKKGTQPVDANGNPEEPFLYWAINFLDHIISFATGRPLTTRREFVDMDMPTEMTMNNSSSIDLPSPFPGMVRIIQMQGLVNEEIGTLSEQSVDIPTRTRKRLMQYGEDLVAYYTSMHPLLAFDVPNFRAHAARGQGGTFLLLHLWFNSVMIALHRPGLRFGQENQLSDNFLCPESRQISLSTARTTSSCLSLAELVDAKSILGSPFIDQAVQMAGLVFIAELRVPPPMLMSSPGSSQPVVMVDTVEKHNSQANYQVCLRTLQSLMVYWRGIGWILTAMEQKARGVKDTDPGEFNVDPHSSVPLTDRKMIQRLLRAADGHHQSSNRGQWSDSTIGIAVAGTTNSTSKQTVTVLESSDSRQVRPDVMQNALTPNTALALDNELVWTSWLDDRFWDNHDRFWDMDFSRPL